MYVDWAAKTGGIRGEMYGVLLLRLIGESGTTTSHDGLGGRTISNEVDSCGGRGWLTSVGGVIGESGSGAKFAALTARLRCQDWICRVKPSKRSTDNPRPCFNWTNVDHPAGLFKSILIDSNLHVTCWHPWSFVEVLTTPMASNFDLIWRESAITSEQVAPNPSTHYRPIPHWRILGLYLIEKKFLEERWGALIQPI